MSSPCVFAAPRELGDVPVEEGQEEGDEGEDKAHTVQVEVDLGLKM